MKPKNNRKITSAILLLTVLSVGVLLGYLFGKQTLQQAPETSTPGQSLWYLILLIFGFYLSVNLHIILHETGHLIFGLLSGYRFVSFRIHSLTLCRTENGLKWAHVKIPGTAGQCLMLPPKPKGDKPIPVVLYTLGGVIFTLLASVVSLLLYPRLPFPFSVILLFSGLCGVVFFLINALPLRGPIPNDGTNLILLLHDPRGRVEFANQLSMNARLTRGEKLCEMPDEWFLRPDDESKHDIRFTYSWVFRCNRLMRVETLSEAKAEMKALLGSGAAILDLHRALLTTDLVFCLLADGSETNWAFKQWNSTMIRTLRKKMRYTPEIMRTEYAFSLLYEKDTAKADRILVQLERAWKTAPYQGEVENERALIAFVRQSARQI